MYGEGEWHVKIHKASRRRTWRKLHLAIDPVTQEIIDSSLTISALHDSEEANRLIRKIKDPIEKLWADGAYDQEPIYNLLHECHIKPVIPPRIDAQEFYSYYTRRYLGKRRFIHPHPLLKIRDQAIAIMNQFNDKKEGREVWKRMAGYGIRSLVETAFMRFKRTFTDKLRSRKLSTQKTEARIKACILNQMIQVGIPYTLPKEASSLTAAI